MPEKKINKNSNLLTSFAPAVGSKPKVLILGSMPGNKSLEMQQYYAHPANSFWKIILQSAGADENIDYKQKVALMTSMQIALWDVLKHCRREGSLDTAIEPESEEPNEIVEFLQIHETIEKICFNGQKAFAAFKKHILKNYPDLAKNYNLVVLPSTSPANATISLSDKTDKWKNEVWPKK